jgi:hypothetical protein
VAAGEDVAAATGRLMDGIAAAVARARLIYPQRPAPGDDGWWTRPPESAFRHLRAGSETVT